MIDEYCPTCGNSVATREDGIDTCESGHQYPSPQALKGKETCKKLEALVSHASYFSQFLIKASDEENSRIGGSYHCAKELERCSQWVETSSDIMEAASEPTNSNADSQRLDEALREKNALERRLEAALVQAEELRNAYIRECAKEKNMDVYTKAQKLVELLQGVMVAS